MKSMKPGITILDSPRSNWARRMICNPLSRTCAFVLLSGVLTNVHAVMLIGNVDCGKWFSHSPQAKGWVAGYMSGLSAAGLYPGEDPLAKIRSAEQVFLWIDNYCRANPLKSVGDAGNALFEELAESKKTP